MRHAVASSPTTPAQGVALIELVRHRFDVVLMNPPFGAGSLPAKSDFEKAYPRTKNDLYAAFVERGIELLSLHGMLGAITSRTGFFLSSFQKWREEILLKEAPPLVFADLGYGRARRRHGRGGGVLPGERLGRSQGLGARR